MVKRIFMLASVAMIMAACQKEKETDFEKGKKDGKKFCDCLTTAATESLQSLCMMQHVDLNKLAQAAAGAQVQINDYTAGLLTAPCALAWLRSIGGVEFEDANESTLINP
jgi:hypothetical protein